MTRAEITERNKLMREYKAQGHTSREVAERFGVALANARYICSGIAPQSYTRNNSKSKDDIKGFIEERIPDFEYIGNYTGADGKADVRCRTCGAVFTRSMITIRHRNVRCRACEAKRIAKRETEKVEMRKAKAEEQKRNAEAKRAEEAQRIEERKHACPVCGTITTRQKYCSKKCAERAHNKTKDHRRRMRLANVTIDKDITVEGLFRRDKGICYLCGGKCDYEDYTVRDGNFITGDWYPTIDHVKPISKGGLHSWDNVRLAHRHCNTLKGAKSK